MDRFGFGKAKELGLVVANKEIDKLRRIILLTEPSKEIGDVVVEVLRRIVSGNEKDDFDTFVKVLFDELDKRGLLEKAKREIEEEERLFTEKLSKAEKINVNDLTILLSRETLAPRHSEVFSQGVDVIIERNSMNPNHSSFIINTASEKVKKADFSKVLEGFPVIFKHPTGFLTVVDVEITKFIEQVKEKFLRN